MNLSGVSAKSLYSKAETFIKCGKTNDLYWNKSIHTRKLTPAWASVSIDAKSTVW